MKKSLPLHIHISTLVIGLILSLGLSSSFYHYIKTSDMLLDLSKNHINALSRDLQADFTQGQHSLSLALDIMLKNTISEAQTLEQRLNYLPALVSVLKSGKNITAVQIGYANGDYFIVRKLAQHVNFKKNAPDKTVYILDNIDHKTQILQRFYSDESAQIIPTAPEQSKTQYDPRKRPWYTGALNTNKLYVSDVYRFYFAKKLGLTFALSQQNKTAVIAADLTLETLGEKLQHYELSPSSQLLIVNQHHQLIAYRKHSILNDLDKMEQDDKENILNLSSRHSPFLNQLQTLTTHSGAASHAFTWQGSQWLADKTDIYSQGDQRLSLIIASPKKELVAGAIKLRNTSFFIQIIALLIAIPIAWLMANRLAKSLHQLTSEAQKINRFDFSSDKNIESSIKEVHALSNSISVMRNTINAFLNIVQTIASETDLDALIQQVVKATCETSKSDVAGIFLMNTQETQLQLHSLYFDQQDKAFNGPMNEATFNYNKEDLIHPINVALNKKCTSTFTHTLGEDDFPLLDVINRRLNSDAIDIYLQPLLNRKKEIIGLLFIGNTSGKQQDQDSWIAFSTLLSNFSAVSLESRQLIQQQKDLMQSFIELIASAIDAKSPYTGGHCQRVPELTKMLAQAASDTKDGPYKDFQLNADQWEELHFSAWLHDCGKVTTPEYVVDKSTKLETLYDRIHEVRMRFEVLKRDAEISTWKNIATFNNAQLETPNNDKLLSELKQTLALLDNDFAFIAQCNIGSEFMAADKLVHLQAIANKTWQRTLDDRLGISWEEAQRKQYKLNETLPITEKLLDDKAEHLIHYRDNEILSPENIWGFKMQQPEYKYNRGEHYNLAIQRGTLNDEERYKINDHIVQTIIMLENLPYPKHLRNVPAIAGGHHEKMDGTGYPRKLHKDEMSLTARMMAVADIFEALTAADRPYKQAKTLTESLKIMMFMVKDQHIDGDLFELFLRSGIYHRYAESFLKPEQMDKVNIEDYLTSG